MTAHAMGSMLPANGTPGPKPYGQVLALHCSGADGRQWRKLALALGPDVAVKTPDFYGCDSTGPWHGSDTFTLADEAKAVVGMIDDLGGPVHLVGHSYGGGVALRVAVERPRAVRSIALYEPSAFHLLRQLGDRGREELAEIRALADDVARGVVCGAYQAAARRFVDYWNGAGAWEALKPEIRMGLLRWLPKAPLDFQALIEEHTPVAAYETLDCPLLVLRGEHALPPSRLIAEELLLIAPHGRMEVVRGAGHMGPMTHAEDVAARIARHIRAVSADLADAPHSAYAA